MAPLTMLVLFCFFYLYLYYLFSVGSGWAVCRCYVYTYVCACILICIHYRDFDYVCFLWVCHIIVKCYWPVLLKTVFCLITFIYNCIDDCMSSVQITIQIWSQKEVYYFMEPLYWVNVTIYFPPLNSTKTTINKNPI